MAGIRVCRKDMPDSSLVTPMSIPLSVIHRALGMRFSHPILKATARAPWRFSRTSTDQLRVVLWERLLGSSPVAADTTSTNLARSSQSWTSFWMASG